MYFDGFNIKLDRKLEKNFITIDEEDFFLSPLSIKYEYNKGANSNIFILNDPDGHNEDKIIKFCKKPLPPYEEKIHKRFKREIRALKLADSKNLNNVIKIFNNGEIQIDDEFFLYFIMEKAQEDLTEHLQKNRLSFSQKLILCLSVMNGINELHQLGIYHRDIKHDNILLINGEWKICDLGLAKFRDDDFEIDKNNEKIGPYGWLSPEVINKVYTYKKTTEFSYDCEIDEKSDIFQLGKLFWFICQGNLPIGNIIEKDFLVDNIDFFNIIHQMLSYSKPLRPEIREIETLCAPLRQKFAI